MLTISQSTYDTLTRDRLNALAKRVSHWLEDELPNWRHPPEQAMARELNEILDAGRAAGMQVETDYALFALLLLQKGIDWRAILAEPNTRQTFHEPEVSAPTKLMWLEQRLSAEGVVLQESPA